MTETSSHRLQKARRAAGFASARQAAEQLGVKYDTYAQHENGTRGFPASRAAGYARAFGVDVSWLLFGTASTAERAPAEHVPIIGFVGANPEGVVLFAEGQESGDLVPLPPGAKEDARALEVRGHSMPGLAENGALIYFEDQHTVPTPDMLGHPVVVEIDTGEVLVKRLLRGRTRGRYDLESIAGPTREDVRIRWVARISAIIPPWKARQIIIRAGIRQDR
jgi:phage repressor protein C with HTH and peptisase S24 domain